MSKNANNIEKNTFAKECMFTALAKLMSEKSFEDITISELTQIAGVSRTTFYRNYRNLEDIIFDYMTVYPFGASSPLAYAPENFDLKARLYDSFTFLKKNKLFIENLFTANLVKLFIANYETLIKGMCVQRAHELGFVEKYELSAFAGMYFMICYDWVMDGMQEDIDYMVETSFEIIDHFRKGN